MTEVIMPKMGDGMEEGTLVEWLKAEGDVVKSGQVIGTIQTDKATLELEAPGSGVLSGLLIKAGDTVPVGKPIAALLKDGETLPAGWGSSSSPKKDDGAVNAVPVAVGATVQSASIPAADAGRIKASPLARKMAEENELDLAAIVGSGPGGRIVEKDVQAALAGPKRSASVPTPIAVSAEDRVVPLNRLRQITAQRTAQSKQQVPHFYVSVEVDLERITSIREQFERDGADKPSINDFVIKACALALRQMPQVNAVFQGDSILVRGAVNIGVAAATDDGLTVPVIKNADQLGLAAIASESKRLVGKAREGKLSPDELSDSTFSISNMGMLNVDQFAAIINPPNSAIVAIGTARRQVVPTDDDSIEIRTRMSITGSFDHRVVDGAQGAQFVNVIRELLENPTRMLV